MKIIHNMVRKHFGIVRALYSSSVYDMTDLLPKYWSSFILDEVTKHGEYTETFCTQHSMETF